MTDAPELLPCPFCGSQKALVLPCDTDRERQHRIYPIVRCCGCYLDLPGKNADFSEDGRTAVAAWNTRANQQVLDAAREEGRRVGLEEAAKAVEILKGQCFDQHVKIWAENRAEAIRALIDKPADPVVEKARKPKDHDRTMKEALFGLIGSSQEPVENPVREDISYGGVLVNTPDGPKVAYLRLSFENIAQKDGK